MIDEIEKEYNSMTDNQRHGLTLEQYRNHVRNMKEIMKSPKFAIGGKQ